MKLGNRRIQDVTGRWVPVGSVAYDRSLFLCAVCGLLTAGARFNWRRGLCKAHDAAPSGGAATPTPPKERP